MVNVGHSWVVLVALGAPALGCSEPDLSTTNFRCDTSADCASGEECVPFDTSRACRPRGAEPLRIGMSGPLQGASRDLGNEMRRGIDAMFSRVNEDRGGVSGRRLELLSMNDNYDPALALQVTRQLLDIQRDSPHPDEPDVRGPGSVFALLGSVGTPTMLATAPLATKNRVLFFGPFTGSKTYLRDGTSSPYVYNYRAGYYDEAEAIIDYLASARLPRVVADPAADHQRILVFAQNDSYGDAGYQGLVEAYNRRVGPLPSADAITRVGYERDDVESVEPAIAATQEYLLRLLGDGSVRQSAALVMVDTYQPGDKFIRAIKDWLGADATRAARLDVLFVHVSFVGSDSLSAALVSPPETYADAASADGSGRSAYAEGVMVTQVVPSYTSQASAVLEYRTDIDRFDGGPYTFTSLEGYIAARLFITGLELNGPDLTTESLQRTLDTQINDLDLGIGALLSFSPTDHQAMDAVWLSEVQRDGSFAVPYVWTPEEGIVPN